MTRINSAINPKHLTDQHLIAELRELPRIFTLVQKRIDSNKEFNDIPTVFTLGSGHCKFFYDKLNFLAIRYISLLAEYESRFDKSWKYLTVHIPKYNHNIYKDHTPTIEESNLLIERLSTKIKNSPQIPRFYKKEISKDDAVKMINFSKP